MKKLTITVYVYQWENYEKHEFQNSVLWFGGV